MLSFHLSTQVKTPVKDLRQSQVASLRDYAVHSSPTLTETYNCEPYTESANPLHSSVPKGGSPSSGSNITHTHGNDYQRQDVKRVDRVEVTVMGTGMGSGTGTGVETGLNTGAATVTGSGTKILDSRRGSLSSAGKHQQKTLADLSILYNSTTASSRAKQCNSIEPFALHTSSLQNGLPDSSEDRDREREKEKDNVTEKGMKTTTPSAVLTGTNSRKSSKSILPRDIIPDNTLSGAKSVRGGRRESDKETVKTVENENTKIEYTDLMKQKEIDNCFEWVKKASELLQQLPPSSSSSPSHTLSPPPLSPPQSNLLQYSSPGDRDVNGGEVHADLNTSLRAARDEHIRQITATAAFIRHKVGRSVDISDKNYENLAKSVSCENSKNQKNGNWISPTNKIRQSLSTKSTDNRDVLSPSAIDGIALLKLKNSAEKKGLKEGAREGVKEVVIEGVKQDDPDPSRALQLEAMIAYLKNEAEAKPGEPYTRSPFPFIFPSTTNSPLPHEMAALPMTPSTLPTTPSSLPLPPPLSLPHSQPPSHHSPDLHPGQNKYSSPYSDTPSYAQGTPTTSIPLPCYSSPVQTASNLTTPSSSVIPMPRSPAVLPLYTPPPQIPCMQRSLTPPPSLIRPSLSGSQLLRTPPRSASPSLSMPVPYPSSTANDTYGYGYPRSASPSSFTGSSTSTTPSTPPSSTAAGAVGVGGVGVYSHTHTSAAISALTESPGRNLKKNQVQSFFKTQRSESTERGLSESQSQSQPINLMNSYDKFPLTQLLINESICEIQNNQPLTPQPLPLSPTEYDSHSPPFILSTTHSPTHSSAPSPPYISNQFATSSPVSSTTHSSIGTPSHRVQLSSPAPVPALAPVPNLVRPNALSRKSANSGINEKGIPESASSRSTVSPLSVISNEMLNNKTDKNSEIIQKKIEKALISHEIKTNKEEKNKKIKTPEINILTQDRWSSPMKKLIPKNSTILNAEEKKKQRMLYGIKAITEKTNNLIKEKKIKMEAENEKIFQIDNNDDNSDNKNKIINKSKSKEHSSKKKSDVWDGNITSSSIIETPEKKTPKELQPYLRRKINPLLKSPSTLLTPFTPTPSSINPIIKTPVLERRAFKGGDLEPVIKTPPIQLGELLHFDCDSALLRPEWNDNTHVIPIQEPFPLPSLLSFPPSYRGIRTPPRDNDSGTKSINSNSDHDINLTDVYRNAANETYNTHGYNPKINELDVELRLKNKIKLENEKKKIFDNCYDSIIINADSGSVNLSHFDILSVDDSVFSTLLDSPTTAVSGTCSESTTKNNLTTSNDDKNNNNNNNNNSNSNSNSNSNGKIENTYRNGQGNNNGNQNENGNKKGNENANGHGNGNTFESGRGRVNECSTITPHPNQIISVNKEIGLTMRERMQLKLDKCEGKEKEN